MFIAAASLWLAATLASAAGRVNAATRNENARPWWAFHHLEKQGVNACLGRTLLPGNLLHQIHDRAAQIAIFNVGVCPQQAKRTGDGQQF